MRYLMMKFTNDFSMDLSRYLMQYKKTAIPKDLFAKTFGANCNDGR